ncbi:hypothetical protein [Streptomyces lavendulocolor]|uniref:hypothetical protein n=1 Tax=Streptomyces lavendulocolor TaxID=67316 RepID=UPI003C2ACB68
MKISKVITVMAMALAIPLAGSSSAVAAESQQPVPVLKLRLKEGVEPFTAKGCNKDVCVIVKGKGTYVETVGASNLGHREAYGYINVNEVRRWGLGKIRPGWNGLLHPQTHLKDGDGVCAWIHTIEGYPCVEIIA